MRYLLICFQTGLLRVNTAARKIEGGPSVNRFRLSARDYNNIREIVVDNNHVMEQTNIQLPEISVWTLSQWYVFYCPIYLLPIPPPGPPELEA